MMETGEFGKVFLFLLGAVIFTIIGMLANYFLAPKNPDPEKLTTYECGEEPIGDAGIQFNSRFYLIGLVFLIFEVEVLFFFPWTTVFSSPDYIAEYNSWGILALIEMLIFAGILILGLVYVWKKGDLVWMKPKPQTPVAKSEIPEEWYEAVNKRY